MATRRTRQTLSGASTALIDSSIFEKFVRKVRSICEELKAHSNMSRRYMIASVPLAQRQNPAYRYVKTPPRRGFVSMKVEIRFYRLY